MVLRAFQDCKNVGDKEAFTSDRSFRSPSSRIASVAVRASFGREGLRVILRRSPDLTDQLVVGQNQVERSAEHGVVGVSEASQTLQTKLVRVTNPDVRHDHLPSPFHLPPPPLQNLQIYYCAAKSCFHAKVLLSKFGRGKAL